MSRCEICPDHNQLIRFVRGQLAEPDITSVEQHLETCIQCSQSLGDLRPGNTDVLNSLASAPDLGEDTDRRLVTELVEQISDWRPRVAWSQSAAWSERLGERTASISELEAWLKRVLPPEGELNGLGRLGPFVLLRILGVGGMGIVCEAEDPVLKRKVAIKILKPELAGNSMARQRFMLEARAAAAIEHANVVALHLVGEDCGLPYFAMPLLSGVTLQEYAGSCGPLSNQTVLSIARQIASGLAAAHRNGLIHQDIKPANIFVVHYENEVRQTGAPSAANVPLDGPQVKLLDFGLARSADAGRGPLDSESPAGTPSYMSPEQAQGQRIDHRSDLFSLGCVLYWMCTGQSPFGGLDKRASLLAVSQHHPPTPDTVNPAIPKSISTVIMKLLQKDPGARFQSAAEVIDALGSAIPAAKGVRKSTWPIKWVGISTLAVGMVALAIIIYVMTGKGMLVLEVSEPDVKVSVDGAQVEIKSSRDNIALAVGDHELEVTKDGFTSYTKRFQVRRGEKIEIAARLEPLPNTTEAASSAKQNTELTIEVPAIHQWTATGVALHQGMELQIVASGSVDAAPEADTREYYQQVPPAGRQERLGHFPEPLLPGLGLLGRIGNGRTFFVGGEVSLIVTATDGGGELYLGINDDLVEDNFGAWKVKIATRHASSK